MLIGSVIRAIFLGLAIAGAVAGGGCDAPPPERVVDQAIVDAVRRNNAWAVQAWLELGGAVDGLSADGDALVYVASGPKGGAAVLNLLLDAGGSPDARSRTGRTALQNAASWCDTEIVRILLDAGAAINLPGKDDKTAAQSVCVAPVDRRIEVLALLRARGAEGL